MHSVILVWFVDLKKMSTVLDRIRGALVGLYIADAVAMPVHWMYSRAQLKADYGTVAGYVCFPIITSVHIYTS